MLRARVNLSERRNWYKEYIGQEFDVMYSKNQLNYSVLDTKHNRQILHDRHKMRLNGQLAGLGIMKSHATLLNVSNRDVKQLLSSEE